MKCLNHISIFQIAQIICKGLCKANHKYIILNTSLICIAVTAKEPISTYLQTDKKRGLFTKY